MTFIPLRTHSYYSFCEGVASPKALVSAAARHGLSALALTDRWLTGAVEFYLACRAAEIKPLLGLELEVIMDRRPTRLVLLAQDARGWASLCALSSLQRADADSDSGLPYESLASHTTSLIALAEVHAERPLERLRDLFADRLYLAVSQADEAHAALAERTGVPLVAAPPVYYLTPDEADLQRTLAAIRLNTPRTALRAHDVAPPLAHFPAPDEMAARFRALPDALAATHAVAGGCHVELPLGVPHYPKIDLPPGLSAAEVLRQKAAEGAQRLYGTVTPEIQSRLDHELSILSARGYAPLFLIVQELLEFARSSGVPISSRGSAASSLVAHCLGLTSPDPLRLNLYFERFLNPARSTPPDIDTDLCSRRRDGVIQHVFERYGHERVALVCTINRFRERSALRETAKAFGVPPAEVNQLIELLPERWGPPHLQPKGEPPFAELQRRFPQHRTLFEHAARLLRQPHHLSLHPGGVVITPGPLTERVPTFQAAKGLPATQLDLEAVEALGLIKIDLLGIRGLTVVGDVAEALAARQHGSHDRPPLAILEAVPDDDPATRDLIRGARTIGCFQIESPGMRATLKEINAQSIDDLMIALALYRPGPMTGGLKDDFVQRHLGKAQPQQLHPALEPLLRETYGVILYQEQVLRIAHELAGLSLADADLLRRAMSHFDPGKQMQSLKERFVAGAAAKHSVPPDVGERVWELMAAFAGYGFPKAHAASYAQVAWRAAWCKAHHPAEFMAAVLANWGGFYPQRVYLTEARRMGLRLRPPHINHSHHEFRVVYEAGQPVLYMGLDQVRDLTQRVIERTLRERPFTSLQDFLTRVDPRPQEAENLIRVGALDGLGLIPGLLRELKDRRWERGQMALFEPQAQAGDDWSLPEKVAAQEELLRASVIAHRLELDDVRIKIAQAGALNTAAAAGQLGRQVKVAGMRQTWRRSATASGGFIYFMALEDLEGMLDVVIFDQVYRRSRAALTGSNGPFVVEGALELDPAGGEPVLRAERIEAL